ncbi:MAG TPA: peptidase inhibitor I78 [Caulobacteraceae bacterium]|nr:peptidase inhibitor I78 [Caulobacteraceae bacterium]
MGKAGLSLLLLAAASCAPLEAPRELPAGPPPAAVTPPPPVVNLPPDYCGARELQHLIGQHRSQIPVPLHPSSRRVTCTTCPVTEDYSPYRLNIFYDRGTDIIKEVRCG